MIGDYCKRFRLEQGLTLQDVINTSGDKGLKVGTLSSFEMGRSSNIKHLETYIKVAKNINCIYEFMNNLTIEVLHNGK